MGLEKVTEDAANKLLAGAGYITEESTEVDNDTEDKEIDREQLTEEEVAKHVCPLCESFVEDGISDETLLEHYEAVVKIMDSVNEDSEMSEYDILVQKAGLYDEAIAELESEGK